MIISSIRNIGYYFVHEQTALPTRNIGRYLNTLDVLASPTTKKKSVECFMVLGQSCTPK
jgi:hypothetical protein